MAKTNSILKIYRVLLSKYGYQGWWPLVSQNSVNYHPANYSIPKNDLQRFEICIGAIATQNTSWLQAERALCNLKVLGALDPMVMNKTPLQKLKKAIRPAGYFNQKTKKIMEFTKFYNSLDGAPTRERLLKIWGIGPETADSILLYGFMIPTFVVDAYTKRIFVDLNMISEEAKYAEIKSLFEENLPKDFKIYQEYHALIVKHAKEFYRGKNSNVYPIRSSTSIL